MKKEVTIEILLQNIDRVTKDMTDEQKKEVLRLTDVAFKLGVKSSNL